MIYDLASEQDSVKNDKYFFFFVNLNIY